MLKFQSLRGGAVGLKEKYELTWPGKRQAKVTANTPTTNTLRPVKEKSVDFDNTQNIYIEGDNLEALKILQESYLGKIKCIYIDPPYNTGNDFIYKDNFNKGSKEELEESGQVDEEGNRLVKNADSSGRYHSDWLSMMYPRLKLARNLLSDEGVIFISIDDNEKDNLKKICDEIFGQNAFLGTLIQSKGNAQNDAIDIQKNHEYIIVYSKQRTFVNGKQKTLLGEEKESIKDVFVDENGKYFYKGSGLVTGGAGGTLNKRKNLGYTIYYNKKTNDKIAVADYDVEKALISNVEEEVYSDDERLISQGYEKIRPPKKGKLLGRWTWSLEKFNNDKDKIFITNNNSVVQKVFIDKNKVFEENGKMKYKETNRIKNTRSILEFSTSKGTTALSKLLGNKYFDNPKNVEMLKYLIGLIDDKDFVVLDFFSGSGSIGHAVMECNEIDGGRRKYILVQFSEEIGEESEAYKAGYKNICDIGEERIRRAASKIKEENGLLADNLDLGFRVYKLDSSNMKDVYYKPNDIDQVDLTDLASNIKEDRTAEDLLTQVILDLGLTLDLKIEEKKIKNNNVFFVADNSLVACFDDEIDMGIIDEICKCKPLKLVLKDSSFKNDSDKINYGEKIKKLSPETEIKVL